MESYIVLQARHAPASKRVGRAAVMAAIRVVAAASVTAGLTLALLPPADFATVQRSLAAATVRPGGELHRQA